MSVIKQATIRNLPERKFDKKLPTGLEMNLDSPFIYLVGGNGSGKTYFFRSIFESVYNELEGVDLFRKASYDFYDFRERDLESKHLEFESRRIFEKENLNEWWILDDWDLKRVRKALSLYGNSIQGLELVETEKFKSNNRSKYYLIKADAYKKFINAFTDDIHSKRFKMSDDIIEISYEGNICFNPFVPNDRFHAHKDNGFQIMNESEDVYYYRLRDDNSREYSTGLEIMQDFRDKLFPEIERIFESGEDRNFWQYGEHSSSYWLNRPRTKSDKERAADKQLVFLEEPFSYLDLGHQLELVWTLEKYSKKYRDKIQFIIATNDFMPIIHGGQENIKIIDFDYEPVRTTRELDLEGKINKYRERFQN